MKQQKQRIHPRCGASCLALDAHYTHDQKQWLKKVVHTNSQAKFPAERVTENTVRWYCEEKNQRSPGGLRQRCSWRVGGNVSHTFRHTRAVSQNTHNNPTMQAKFYSNSGLNLVSSLCATLGTGQLQQVFPLWKLKKKTLTCDHHRQHCSFATAMHYCCTQNRTTCIHRWVNSPVLAGVIKPSNGLRTTEGAARQSHRAERD